jgi:hypothetical protein
MLSHIGQQHLSDTMSMIFYHPQLRKSVEAVLMPSAVCHQYKNVQCGHGEIAPSEVGLFPWRETAVEMIGPWTL